MIKKITKRRKITNGKRKKTFRKNPDLILTYFNIKKPKDFAYLTMDEDLQLGRLLGLKRGLQLCDDDEAKKRLMFLQKYTDSKNISVLAGDEFRIGVYMGLANSIKLCEESPSTKIKILTKTVEEIYKLKEISLNKKAKILKKNPSPFRSVEPEKFSYTRTRFPETEFIPDRWYIIFDRKPDETIRIAQFDHKSEGIDTIGFFILPDFWFNIMNDKTKLIKIYTHTGDRKFLGPFVSEKDALVFAHSNFPGVTLINFKYLSRPEVPGGQVKITHSILGTKTITDSYITRI